MEIRLIVIRTEDYKRLSEFYELLGCSFTYHKHGSSPYHYSATIGQTILEIYPLAKNQTSADKNLRLGFVIDHFDDILQYLKEQNVVFIQEPTETEFGFLAIIEDPDGRKIELYRK